MAKFIKIITKSDGAYIRSWIAADRIVQISQNSITQEGNDEGTCVFVDGTTMPIVAVSKTIDSINQL